MLGLLMVAAEVDACRGLPGINQKKLAHRADVDRSLFAKLDLGQSQPFLAVIVKNAKALEWTR